MRILLIVVFFLISCNSVFAYENDIGISRIDPSSPAYFLKTIRENLENSLALTPRVKSIRQLEFSTRRLREVKALVLNGREDLIEPTMERYWFHVKRLLNDEFKDEEITLRIKESLIVHLKTLDIIYSQLSNQDAKRATRSALNRLMEGTALPASARLPVCNFFAKEASSSALNQSEQVILKLRAEKCLKGSL